MRKKIAIYALFVLLFVLGKFLFMCYYGDIFGAYALSDRMAVLWNGLPHDLACAGYLMALPFLAQFVFIWFKGEWHRSFMRFWLRLVIFLVLINYISDLFLYGYWGFRIDGTVMIYFLDNPAEAIEQMPIWMMIVVPLLLFGLWWTLQRFFCVFYPERKRGASLCLPTERTSFIHTGLNLLCCVVLFIAIRGGVTTSTLNIGRVYFSSEMPLNQAATNPLFSFMHSMMHKKADFSKQYRFMSAEEASSAMAEMNSAIAESEKLIVKSEKFGDEAIVADSVLLLSDSLLSDSSLVPLPSSLLRVKRPNIVLLILESFSGSACQAVWPEADSTIMPNINRIYREGIGFTNVFANSFRTDRGVAAVLASYPGQPTNSVMKDQSKCNHLQYMSKRLKENGYDLHFVHGGDVDFTNMRGFLTAGGFEQITGDTDFPIGDRMSKWGVPDHKMFDYLFDEIEKEAGNGTPSLKVMLTLSSHEPFDVEYHHFKNEYVNSIAYVDSCIGNFVDRLKNTSAWDNLLIIGVADHSYANYPAGLQNHELLRYRIPMFWTGGAIERPVIIDTYGSQTDLSATLFGQMDIDCQDFNFSKNLLDPSIGHYAFYAFSDGFGFVNDSISYIQDNARSGQGLSGTNDPEGKAELWGKAYLQTLYDDLSKR